MSVQALGAELAVEALDVAVVRRLARPGEVEDDALVVGPQVEVSRDEFAAIVDANGGRVTELPAHPFQGLDHILAAVTEACINCWREAREGIDDCQHPDLAARRQLVVHEVHGPDMVGMGRFRAIGPQLRLDPTLGYLIAELEVHLLVKTIDSLRVNRPAVTLEQHVHTTVAIAYPCLADVLDPQLQFGLLAAPGLVDVQRPIDLQHRTCAPDRSERFGLQKANVNPTSHLTHAIDRC